MAALGLPLALPLLACSGSPGELMNSTSSGNVEVPPWACVPGETQPCPCADGPPGLVTCEPDGTAFGECDCSPGAVSQEPPLTSTGSDTGMEGTATGDTTEGPTSGSTSAPDPTTTSESSSSGAPDPTTSGGSTGASSSSG